MSGGTSNSTGRGRPVRICSNASRTRPGISSGVMPQADHFVTDFSISCWKGISCNMPRPTPIRSDWICPERQSTGAEQAYAVESAAVALRSPGPGTTRQTPTLPVVRAYPSAM